jgi:hypothetical protein
MASEQTKEATVAIAKELTIPIGGDDAKFLSWRLPPELHLRLPRQVALGLYPTSWERERDRSKSRPSCPSSPCQRRRGHPRTNAAAPEPKRGRTEPPVEGSISPKGNAGPPARKPTLSQAFDIHTFAKGVEQEVKKMAKVAIQSALPRNKVLEMTW